MRCRRAIAVLLVLTMTTFGAGCHSMRRVEPVLAPEAPTFGSVRGGDTVALVLKDGRKARFVVKQIDGETLVASDGARYARPDIVELKRREFSGVKTGFLIGGIAATTFLFILAAAVASSLGGLY